MKKFLLSIAVIVAAFVSNAQTPQLINGNFEATVSSPLPGVGQTLGWGTGIFTAETGANAFAGTQSAKITTLNSPAINQAVGWGSDTIPGFIQQQIAGTIANPADLVLAFTLKYAPVNSDTALVVFEVYDTLLAGGTDDVLLFQGVAEIGVAVANWTPASLPLQANPNGTGTANLISIIATASAGGLFSSYAAPTPGSSLFLDNVSIGVASINENNLTASKVFPNPASDVLNVVVEGELSNVSIATLDGKIVKNSTTSTINVSDLNAGMYIYTVTTAAGKVATGNFVKN